MSRPVRDIPQVGNLPAELGWLRRFLESVREVIQTRDPQLAGRGDELDKYLTRRDAASGQWAIVGSNGTGGGGGGGGGGVIIIEPPAPAPGTGGTTPDLTPPPTPSGFMASAGLTNVYVSTDVPVYEMGHGHQSTVIFGAKWPLTQGTPPTFADAVQVWEYLGNPSAFPTEPATRWCLWAKWKTADGVMSTVPAGGTNGLVVSTAEDVAALLDLLTGKITESQLYKSLGTSIRPFAPWLGWSFTGTLEGWTATAGLAAGVASTPTELSLTATSGGELSITRTLTTAEQFAGEKINKVRARLKRVSGTSWTGRVYWSNAAHGFTTGFYRDVAEPQWDENGWALVEWDMVVPTAGADWVTSTITGVRLDLQRAGTASAQWRVDWISIGTEESGISGASFRAEQQARVDGDTATATQISAMQAAIAQNAAAIQQEAQVRADQDGALASLVETVSAGAVTSGQNLVANSSFEFVDPATTNNLAARWGVYRAGAAGVATYGEAQGRLSGRAQRIFVPTLGTADADRSGLFHEIAIAPGSMDRIIASIYAQGTGGAKVRLQVNLYAGATLVATPNVTADLTPQWARLSVPVTAIATNVDRLRLYCFLASSTVAGQNVLTIDDAMIEPGAALNVYTPGPGDALGGYAAVQTEAIARASETGQLLAQYTVKVDLNGYVAGYGLAATANNGTPSSDFAIRADRFYLAPPINYTQETAPSGATQGQLWRRPSTDAIKAWSGSAWIDFTAPLPFIVQTTRQVVNGVTIQPGVYMDGAFIVNLQATIARLGTAWIDSAMVGSLDAVKLTAGNGTIGNQLRSENYDAGTAGWILKRNGDVEFGFAGIRGTLLARQVTAGFVTADMMASGLASMNLVANGDPDVDDQNTAHWYVCQTSGNGGTFNRSSTSIASMAPLRFGLNKANPSDGVAVACRPFPVIPGNTYRIRLKANASETTAQGRYIRILHAASRPLNGQMTTSNSTIANLVGSNGVWLNNTEIIERTWTCPPGSYWATLAIYNWVEGPTTLALDEISVYGTSAATLIRPGSIVSGDITVDTLSALTGNMGRLIAGIIDNDRASSDPLGIVLNLDAQGTDSMLRIGSTANPLLRIQANGNAQFGGKLTANAVDAVDTLNIRDQAVTVPSSFSGSDGTVDFDGDYVLCSGVIALPAMGDNGGVSIIGAVRTEFSVSTSANTSQASLTVSILIQRAPSTANSWATVKTQSKTLTVSTPGGGNGFATARDSLDCVFNTFETRPAGTWRYRMLLRTDVAGGSYAANWFSPSVLLLGSYK